METRRPAESIIPVASVIAGRIISLTRACGRRTLVIRRTKYRAHGLRMIMNFNSLNHYYYYGSLSSRRDVAAKGCRGVMII